MEADKGGKREENKKREKRTEAFRGKKEEIVEGEITFKSLQFTHFVNTIQEVIS